MEKNLHSTSTYCSIQQDPKHPAAAAAAVQGVLSQNSMDFYDLYSYIYKIHYDVDTCSKHLVPAYLPASLQRIPSMPCQVRQSQAWGSGLIDVANNTRVLNHKYSLVQIDQRTEDAVVASLSCDASLELFSFSCFLSTQL